MVSNHSKHICPAKDESGPAIQPILGNFSFHEISMIAAAAAGSFSILIATLLILRHATHYSCQEEQKQIIRIIGIIPSFAIISFLCVWQDGSAAPYISPGRDVAESLPMGAFFLLMTAYIAPSEDDRDDFFDQMALLDKKGTALEGGSLAWYHKLAFSILQWIPVSAILWAATAISMAAGTYCATSNSIHFAHIWITIVRSFSTFLAISAILRFYTRSKAVFKPRGVFKQLVCFKIIVFLNFVQTLAFSLLSSHGVLKPSKYLTYDNLINGLPSLILSIELALVAPFFLVAYPVRPYKLGSASASTSEDSIYYPNNEKRYGGALKAIFQAVNIIDVVFALLKGVKAKSSGRQSRPRTRYAAEIPLIDDQRIQGYQH